LRLGTPAKLSEEQKAQLVKWLRQGPGLGQDGVVRWRLSDLRKCLFERMFVMLDERSVGRIVTALGFSHISVRPRDPEANEDDQMVHKNFAEVVDAAIPVGARDEPLEL
jgi:transposase